MSSLPVVDGNRAMAAFAKFGFNHLRTTGSHAILKKDGHRYLLSVPLHAGTKLKPGTLRSLIRTAGITVEQFRNAL